MTTPINRILSIWTDTDDSDIYNPALDSRSLMDKGKRQLRNADIHVLRSDKDQTECPLTIKS